MGNMYGSDGGSRDDESIEEWLEELAEARDHSKEELVQELSSSMWVLDELESILSEAKLHGTGDSGPDRRTGRSTRSPRPTDREREEVADIKDDLETFHSKLLELKNELDAVRNETGEDVESIEEILRYLVNQTDSLSERVSRLESSVETNADSLESLNQTRNRLETLRNAAIQNGVSSAACEHCSTTVDIGLLMRPECPQCGASFDSLEPKSWFFGTNVITTTPARNRRQPTRQSTDPEPSFEDAFNADQRTQPESTRSAREPPSQEMQPEFGFNLEPKGDDPDPDDGFDSAKFNFSTDDPGTDEDRNADQDDDSFDW